MRPLRTLALALAVQTQACGAASGESPKSVTAEPARAASGVADDSKSPWEACYSTFSPAGDPESDLAHLVRDCGPTGGMRAVTPVRFGRQSSDDPVDRYTFEVPASGKCYRVYAAGESSIQDLDLLLRGPARDGFVADVSHDSWPVLPPREPVCFSEPGSYMLEVSVYRGSGRYALQVWGR